MDLTSKHREETERRNRRSSSMDLGKMVYGKVPPQAKDMEEAVLGAILLERHAFDTVIGILNADCFYVEAHQRIFRAMESLVGKGQPIDTLTVVEQLRTSEEIEMVGGPYYITKLTNSVVSSANIESHSRIILQKYIAREVIRTCGESIGEAYEDSTDPFDLLDMIQEGINKIGELLALGDMMPIDKGLVTAIKTINELKQAGYEFTGIPSGFRELDRATLGWQNGDFIILAARPSVGKTAFALNIARNAAMFFQALESLHAKRKSVAIWSLEMKSIRLIYRLLAAESHEWLYRIQTGKLTDEQMKNLYTKGLQILAQLKIFFDDNSGLTLQKLRSKARKLKRTHNLGMIVVDYLQLMTIDEKRNSNREQEVSRISRGLKNLAAELDIPIIALSQMSREFEKRGKGDPMLSDLRESGSIEQDADVVIFLYGPTDAQILEDGSLMNRKYAKVAKQRNGMLITQELNFRDEIQLFEAIEALSTIPGLGGNWRPVSESSRELPPEKDDARLFIQTGDRMHDPPKDDTPF